MARPSHLYMRSLSGRCIVVAVVFVGPITPTSTTHCIHVHVSIIYLISSPEANLPLSGVHADHSGRSFHNLVTLSEKLSFLTFVQARSINNFKL